MISESNFHFLNKNVREKYLPAHFPGSRNRYACITGNPKTNAGYPVFAQILGFFPVQPLDIWEVLLRQELGAGNFLNGAWTNQCVFTFAFFDSNHNQNQIEKIIYGVEVSTQSDLNISSLEDSHLNSWGRELNFRKSQTICKDGCAGIYMNLWKWTDAG